MLGALFMIFTTYLLTKKRNIEISLGYLCNKKLIIALIVIATILFWLLHFIFSEVKTLSRYEDNWQEDGLRFVRGIIVLSEAALYVKILMNVDKGNWIFYHALLGIVFIIIMNAIELALIDHYYSKNIREMIVDGILIQIQDTRNALILVLAVLCILNWTLLGFLFVLVLLAIVTGFFK